MASSRGPSVQQNKVCNVASVICAGDQQYRLNDSVFVVWGNETGIRRRWYAAYIVGHVKNPIQQSFSNPITMGMGFPTRVLDLDNSCFDMENFDVIVVCGTISRMLRAEFAENHVPVVNEEWLVQSLVYGRKQDARDKRFECSVRKENGRKRSVEWNDPERVASRLKDRYRALYS